MPLLSIRIMVKERSVAQPGNGAQVLYRRLSGLSVTTHQDPGRIYTQGVENATGTVSGSLAGRVAADYGLEHDAVRFTTSPH